MIDIAIKSASRPVYLRRTLRSLRKYLKAENNSVYWILHEDCIDPVVSEVCIYWSHRAGFFNQIRVSNPCIGNSESIRTLVGMSDSKYILHWEDDWELLKEIDLDKVIDLMDRNDDVNMVGFRRGLNKPYGQAPEETIRKEGKLVKCYDWVLFPAIWRREYIVDAFELQFSIMEKNADDIGKMIRMQHQTEAMGVYFWGGFGEGDFVEHIDDISTGVLREDRNG